MYQLKHFFAKHFQFFTKVYPQYMPTLPKSGNRYTAYTPTKKNIKKMQERGWQPLDTML